MTATDDDWQAVIANLQKARNRWYCMAYILGQKSADIQMPGIFYVAVVQAILPFGSEVWVVTPRIKRLWGEFHHMVARQILVKMPRQRYEGTW